MATPFNRDIKTIANILSLGRVVLVLLTIVLVRFYDQLFIGLIVGVMAGLTDFLDGYMARRLNQASDLGAVLDQYSDLMYEGLFFLLLVSLPNGLNAFFLGAYLAREFWVMSIRRLMAERGIAAKSSMVGKIKTHLYSYGFILFWLNYAAFFPSIADELYQISLVIFSGGLFFAYWSGLAYTRAFIRGYNESEGQVDA